MVFLKTKTKELLSTLKLLEGAIPKQKEKAILATVEITLIDGNALFTMPGAVFSLSCETKGTCKASIRFLHIYEIIKQVKTDNVEIYFKDNCIEIGSISINAKTTFFKDDKILRSINLPANYSAKDLLLLPYQGYTKEELDFNNITILIEETRKKVLQELKNKVNITKKYGIHINEIEKLLNYKPRYNAKGQLSLFNIDNYIIDDLSMNK